MSEPSDDTSEWYALVSAYANVTVDAPDEDAAAEQAATLLDAGAMNPPDGPDYVCQADSGGYEVAMTAVAGFTVMAESEDAARMEAVAQAADLDTGDYHSVTVDKVEPEDEADE